MLFSLWLNIDWFNSIASVAALATALASLWTVMEMKKQRESSYHPEIYISSQFVYFYARKFQGHYEPFEYSLDKLSPDEKNEHAKLDRISIGVHNIGIAAAKSISYQWKYDVEDMISKIKELNKNSFYEIHYEGGLLDILPNTTEGGRSGFTSDDFKEFFLNYLLPSSFTEASSTIRVPQTYLNLFSLYLSAFYTSFDKEVKKEEFRQVDLKMEDLPPLSLTFTYNDLGNKKQVKSFRLQFRRSFYSFLKTGTSKDLLREIGIHKLIVTEI
jgi:hypothetical protein